MKLAVLDFETYYDKDYSLSKMTTEAYIRDPRFQIIGVGVKLEDAPARWYSFATHAEYAKFLAPLKDMAVCCHHTMFDASILSWVLGIRPKLLLDTLSMARPLHGKTMRLGLEHLAIYYGLGEKGTEVKDAMGKRREHFTETELAEYGAYCRNDVELTHKLLMKLKKGFPGSELRIIDMLLRMYTEPVLELDTTMLAGHIIDVRRNKAASLMKAGVDKETLMSNQKFADALQALGVDPPTKISARTGKEAWAFSKADLAFKALAEHPNPDVQTLVAARLGNKSTLEESRTEEFIAIGGRGTLPVPLGYYNAHTGRAQAAAGQKINLQNLPRGGKLRESIIAPKGHVIVACDSSQIEARVLAWLAGQSDLVKQFADGEDVYSKFASLVFGREINKKEHPQERFVGKTSILGLGYSTGAVKLQQTLKLGGVEMADSSCRQIVDTYRNAYNKIPLLWREADKGIKAMLEGKFYEVGQNGLLKFQDNKVFLPNGMFIEYPMLDYDTELEEYYYVNEPRKYIAAVAARMTDGGKVAHKDHTRLYGAKVIENAVQALARIIVFDQMLAINKRYKVVLTVHDEICIVVPEAEAKEAQAFMEKEMSIAPAWAAGAPIACESGVGRSYGDAK